MLSKNSSNDGSCLVITFRFEKAVFMRLFMLLGDAGADYVRCRTFQVQVQVKVQVQVQVKVKVQVVT